MKPGKWWQWLLIYPTLAVALVGAIPQLFTTIAAYQQGIPVKAVAIAEEQNKLWEKNSDCYRTAASHRVTTLSNEVLELTVCPSGDVLVRIQPPDTPSPYFRWIGRGTFNETAGGSFLPVSRRSAFAGVNDPRADMLAQVRSTVLCQRRDRTGRIIRIIQLPNGRCQEEVINPSTGKVVSINQVSCTSC